MVKTSWQGVEKWYDKTVGSDGHYYHQTVIIPKTLQWLNLKKGDALLDLACGQGVLERHIPRTVDYFGIDGAKSFIRSASNQAISDNHHFEVGDITKPYPIDKKDFSHFTCILALQNVQDPASALRLACEHLKKNGIGILVINHPVLRIPRQTSWHIDEQKKLQSRRIDRYLSPLEIPIQHHPGQVRQHADSITTSFHFSLTDLFSWIEQANMCVLSLEEWISPKHSTGSKARMENRARQEFPLFMALKLQKKG
ncbi:MAG: methyltransferase domain-containing protein [Parachlamydiales bacterium]|nr:methyltransferase domain-containing protein [Parachlamydiales bacterium]